MGCFDYLIILVLHGTFAIHGCLFKIHVTVAWNNCVSDQTYTDLECGIGH